MIHRWKNPKRERSKSCHTCPLSHKLPSHLVWKARGTLGCVLSPGILWHTRPPTLHSISSLRSSCSPGPQLPPTNKHYKLCSYPRRFLLILWAQTDVPLLTTWLAGAAFKRKAKILELPNQQKGVNRSGIRTANVLGFFVCFSPFLFRFACEGEYSDGWLKREVLNSS